MTIPTPRSPGSAGRSRARCSSTPCSRPSSRRSARRSHCSTSALVLAGDDAHGKARGAEYGAPGADVLAFPLVHQGVAVGELRLAARRASACASATNASSPTSHRRSPPPSTRSGSRRSSSWRGSTSSQLREEERRRIRRDLHDGLGPALAGLTFTLEAVRNLTDVGSPARRRSFSSRPPSRCRR